MARGRQDTAVFFFATLVLWFVSVLFEIVFSGRRELLAVVAGCCFFQIANWFIRFSLSRDPLFVNTSVSLLHSTITSFSGIRWLERVSNICSRTVQIGFSADVLWIMAVVIVYTICNVDDIVVLVLFNQWMSSGLTNMFDHSELFSGNWPGAYTALCFSCGYFAYDQLDMLNYHLYSGWIPSILAHHLILLVCFTLALYRNVTINYLVLTLVCEMHSIFLHVRKVRRMAGVRDAESKVVKIEWILNWISFFVARLGCHLFITYKLIVDASKFGNGVELPLAFFGMAGMNLLNLFLGQDLFKAYRREKNPSLHRERKKD